MKNLKDALQKPFEPKDISWKVQRSGRSNGKIWAIVVPYIKTDAIENRLDEIIGPGNWKNEPFQPGANGGLQSGLSIRINDEWVAKWDGADNTQFEGVKGGMSDAFKRAARKWGIGRYLTKVQPAFADVYEDSKGKYRDYIKENGKKVYFSWDPPGLPEFCFSQSSKQPESPPQNTRLSDEEWTRAAKEFQEAAKDIQEIAVKETEVDTKEDEMKDRISKMIATLKAKRIRFEGGKSAYLYATKIFLTSGGDWQKLHDLECKLSNLLAA